MKPCLSGFKLHLQREFRLLFVMVKSSEMVCHRGLSLVCQDWFSHMKQDCVRLLSHCFDKIWYLSNERMTWRGTGRQRGDNEMVMRQMSSNTTLVPQVSPLSLTCLETGNRMTSRKAEWQTQRWQKQGGKDRDEQSIRGKNAATHWKTKGGKWGARRTL